MRRPPCNHRGVHELVARTVRGKCVRQRTERKSVILRSPQPHTTTRANIAHEEAEQIRARIVCTPAESARRELTHMRSVAVRLSSACGKGQDFINPHQAFLIGYQDFLFFQYFLADLFICFSLCLFIRKMHLTCLFGFVKCIFFFAIILT